nr:FtsX-like permease family protein [bacterium]
MNILDKVTLKNMRQNKTRTLVAIIGVILSAAMIMAVASLVSSFQHYALRSTIDTEGDWHAAVYRTGNSRIDEIAGTPGIARVGRIRRVGYALFNTQSSTMPYLYIGELDDNALDMLSIRILEGRLPQNSSEIVIPEQVAKKGLSVGQQLTLTLGDRMYEGVSLGQQDGYMPAREPDEQTGEEGREGETFVPTASRSYTIVGICQRPGYERYSAAGYTVISRLDKAPADGDEMTAYFCLNKPRQVYHMVRELQAGSTDTYDIHSSQLRYMGISNNDAFNNTLYSLAAILIALIMLGSISLIYNDFAISVSERSRQFGLLSSIGATRKQILHSVLTESAIICLIGIPIGILCGMGGIGVTLHFIGGLFNSMTSVTDLPLTLSVVPMTVIITIIIASITVLISAWIPARRASRVSAIEAIRQTDDVRIAPRQVKTGKWVRLLFGMEGDLALKNFKRNRRRYRSTVLSLFISIVLFISASAFGLYLRKSINSMANYNNCDIRLFSADGQEADSAYRLLTGMESITEMVYSRHVYANALVAPEQLTLQARENLLASPTQSGDTFRLYVPITLLDEATFTRYARTLGLDPADYMDAAHPRAIAINNIRMSDSNGRYVNYRILEGLQTLPLEKLQGADAAADAAPTRYPVEVAYCTDIYPMGARQSFSDGLQLFMPQSMQDALATLFEDQDELLFRLSINMEDPFKGEDAIWQLLEEAGLKQVSISNLAQMRDTDRKMLTIINVFCYGFIVLISLITIANVFNTISTNIHLRRREFAMLRSVGMTQRGFNKMMNFECLFYGLKALLWGLPVAIGITFLIYLGVHSGMDTPFMLPWMSIGIAVASVFIVVFITMLYAMARIKKENIVEALKNENL